MSASFRKSLFGFNSDDVMEYIQKTHKEHNEERTVLNEKIDGLSKDLQAANDSVVSLSKANAELEAQLKVYVDKYDEIERLAQSIGKLYVVSNANAIAVMESAKENRNIAMEQVEQNLNCVDATQSSLESTKAEIEKVASEFSDKLSELLTSLDNAKSVIEENNAKSDEKISEYEALIQSL